MEYPKILIISHNCFSASGSNGRTLANFFDGYPVEKLAQFYIYNEMPSVSVCKNYYRITDTDAVRSLMGKSCGLKIKQVDSQQETVSSGKMERKPRKTPLVYLIREMVWKLGRWNNRSLQKWIDDFDPEAVLLQAGDAGFLFDFAYQTAKTRGIPLVIYNSESYYFKDTNYLQQSFGSDCWYGILHRYFRKKAAKAIRYAKWSIYISDVLRKTYDDEFGVPSTTVMTSSGLLGSGEMPKAENITISYLGNLGVGRYETLIELSKILQSIDPALCIDVYGNASEDVVKAFDGADGIRYVGFVSYEECVRIMKQSTILVHVENFSEFYLTDSKYAFSTKIADSLACGTCLFVYAPAQLGCSQYLMENEAACVASEPEEARKKLEMLLCNEKIRRLYEQQAKITAVENHSLERNREKFLGVLCK